MLPGKSREGCQQAVTLECSVRAVRKPAAAAPVLPREKPAATLGQPLLRAPRAGPSQCPPQHRGLSWSVTVKMEVCVFINMSPFNTFNWTVPSLSWLAIVALCVFTIVLYFIPLRYSKKKRFPPFVVFIGCHWLWGHTRPGAQPTGPSHRVLTPSPPPATKGSQQVPRAGGPAAPMCSPHGGDTLVADGTSFPPCSLLFYPPGPCLCPRRPGPSTRARATLST